MTPGSESARHGNTAEVLSVSQNPNQNYGATRRISAEMHDRMSQSDNVCSVNDSPSDSSLTDCLKEIAGISQAVHTISATPSTAILSADSTQILPPLPVLYHPCSWHTPPAELVRLSREFPGQVSHSICEACQARANAELDVLEAGAIGVQLVERVLEETARARRIAALLLVLLAVALPAHAQPALGLAPALTLSVGSAIDLGTSLSSIHSGLGQEGNPFLAHVGTPGLIAWKVGATAGLIVVCQRLAGAGHPKIGKVLAYGVGIGLAGLGMRNAQVGR